MRRHYYMNKIHRKRLIIALLTLLIVFVLIFFAALHNYGANQKTLAMDIGAPAQNIIIMLFSVLSMINIIIELFRVK